MGFELDAEAGRVEPVSLDAQVNPAHYRRGDIEAIDAIRSALSKDEFVGYCRGAAMKYLWRAGGKAGQAAVTDYAKAAWYSRMALFALGYAEDPRGYRGQT